MCLEPRTIVNRSRYLRPDSGQPLYLRVPCGHCSECREMYRNEWRLRSQFEALGCLGSDGFVLFDTLTYSNQYLPRLSDFIPVPLFCDFPCFSKAHLDKFFTTLRNRLRRSGYDIDGKLRYLVAEEYGSLTHTARPHYHVLFFVSFSVDPFYFSELVAQCWPYGRTDGVSYRGRTYVLYHTLFTRHFDTRRIVGYVSKYVTKDINYSRLASSRLSRLRDLDSELYFYAKDFVRPTHYQSKGFGYDTLLKYFSPAYLSSNAYIPVPFDNGLPRRIALPPSLVRKAFYLHCRVPLKTVPSVTLKGRKRSVILYRQHWFATSLLIKYKVNNVQSQVFSLAHRLSLGSPDKLDPESALSALYFDGRLLSSKKSPEEVIKSQYSVACGYRNYAGYDVGQVSKRPVMSPVDLGSSLEGFKKSSTPLSFITLHDFDKSCCCHDPSVDKLVSDYNASVAEYGDQRLKVDQIVSRCQTIFKHLYESYVEFY